MRFLVFGAGAMGGYYGARLIQTGQDVVFMVREKRMAQLQKSGLVVDSVLGGFDQSIEMMTATSPYQEFDVILLACKNYDLDNAINTLVPFIGPHTVILPILNGLAAYDRLDFVFGRDHVIGGVSYIATTLDQRGRVVHQGNNDTLVIGARTPAHRDIVENIHRIFTGTPGKRDLSPNIEQMLWEKWVLISAGAAVTCLLRGNISEILSTNHGAKVIRDVLAEAISVANHAGFAPSAAAQAQFSAILLSPDSTWQASMARDIHAGVAQLEADSILGDLLERGERYAIDMPLVRAAYSHLKVYEAQRKEYLV